MFRLFIKSMLISALFVSPGILTAVETAPRISDREIIEGLAGLNLKYAELISEFKIVHERFKSIDQRFKSIDQRMDTEFSRIDERFEAIDQRFDSLEKRVSESFSGLMNMMLVLFGSLITLIVALFGYIAWDRKTSMRPIENEVQILKQDLEIQRKTAEDTSLNDVLRALREAAKKSPPLADALRNASLL